MKTQPPHSALQELTLRVRELQQLLTSTHPIVSQDALPPDVLRANSRLYEQLAEYMSQLVRRPLMGCYEFRVPVLSDLSLAGWYWRGSVQSDAWHGPFESRKAAVEGRLACVRAAGAPTTSREQLESILFT